jgi:hypothetical protein
LKDRHLSVVSTVFIWILPIRFHKDFSAMKQETQTRLRNLRQLMQSDGCEALMIFPANLRYLAGYGGEAAYALITGPSYT